MNSSKRTTRTIQLAEGIRIHLTEQGDGPLVLLIHGFPESASAWRHQLGPLAEAGFRVAAMDVRGCGRSSKPADVEAYRMLALVSDVPAVVHALGEERAVLVGHDWGSPIASTTALLHPDVVRAVALLGVPYEPPGGPRPTEAFAQIGGDEEFYVSYFQTPGRAEAEVEPDVRRWLAGFYAALSGETAATDVYTIPPGARMSDRFPTTGRRPSWLSDERLDELVAEAERTGLATALHRYRNVDRDWKDLTDWRGLPVHQPALFVAGAADASVRWLADAIEAFPTNLPGCRGVHLLDGCGHWVQQERPKDTNDLLTRWLADLP